MTGLGWHPDLQYQSRRFKLEEDRLPGGIQVEETSPARPFRRIFEQEDPPVLDDPKEG